MPFRVHIVNPPKKRRRKNAAYKLPSGTKVKTKVKKESDGRYYAIAESDYGAFETEHKTKAAAERALKKRMRALKAKKENKNMDTANPKKRRRRRRRSNPTANPSANPRRRRRRTKAANPRRRSRRRNPSGGGMLMSEIQSFIPRLLGKLWVAFLVRRWGGAGSLMGGVQTQSPLMGGSWTMGQYVLAGIGAQIGSRVFGKFVNASEFRKGAWDLILTKLVWTEGLARSPWLQQTFGQAEGQIRVDDAGNTWLYEGGRWQSMQGTELVTASPLDGELVSASPLDGTQTYGYGHLLPASASAEAKRAGMYTGSGYVSAYHAAYGSR